MYYVGAPSARHTSHAPPRQTHKRRLELTGLLIAPTTARNVADFLLSRHAIGFQSGGRCTTTVMYRSVDDAFRQYFSAFIREKKCEQTANESSAQLSRRIDGLFVRHKQTVHRLWCSRREKVKNVLSKQSINVSSSTEWERKTNKLVSLSSNLTVEEMVSSCVGASTEALKLSRIYFIHKT